MAVQQISASQARALCAKGAQFLDVREYEEVVAAPYTEVDVLHIPMRDVPARLGELNMDKPIVVACHSGGRSQMVGEFLVDNNFDDVYNLTGGILHWMSGN